MEPTAWPCDHGVVRLADAHRCIQLLQYFYRQSLLGAGAATSTDTEQLWGFQSGKAAPLDHFLRRESPGRSWKSNSESCEVTGETTLRFGLKGPATDAGHIWPPKITVHTFFYVGVAKKEPLSKLENFLGAVQPNNWFATALPTSFRASWRKMFRFRKGFRKLPHTCALLPQS